MNKIIIGSITITIVTLGAIVLLLRNPEIEAPLDSTLPTTNISNVDSKQVIQITAKGGYAPRITNAKANTPTIINVQTNGTFDCSSALTIPSIGFRTNLPASGITPIEIPPQQPGTTLQGICSMGMYSFTVNFI